MSDKLVYGQELEIDPSLQAKQSQNQHPVVLQGSITTLESAIIQEKGIVDWYAWYLACRDYLRTTGGLNCGVGTMIRFYKNGKVEALTNDPFCRISAAEKRFPLPMETRLQAVGFPVRAGQSPPASQDEVYTRTQGQ